MKAKHKNLMQKELQERQSILDRDIVVYKDYKLIAQKSVALAVLF